MICKYRACIILTIIKKYSEKLFKGKSNVTMYVCDMQRCVHMCIKDNHAVHIQYSIYVIDRKLNWLIVCINIIINFHLQGLAHTTVLGNLISFMHTDRLG
jgi:hypothetical protein